MKKPLIYFFFILHSSSFSLWILSIPLLKERLGLSESLLGLSLSFLPLGSLLGIYFGRKIETIKSIIALSLLFLFGFSFAMLSNTIEFVILFLFITGFSSSNIIVKMNLLAVNYEKTSKENIIGKCHSLYSLGAVISVILGNLFLYSIGVRLIFFAFSVYIVLAIILIKYFLSLMKDNLLNIKIIGFNDFIFKIKELKHIINYLLFGFICMMLESTIANWIGIYSIDYFDMKMDKSGIAFLIFSLSMFAGRLLLDILISRYSIKIAFNLFKVLSLSGLLITIISSEKYLFFCGLFLTGFGISILIPILYKVSKYYKFNAISYLTGSGIIAFFIAPIIIGFISDIYSLKIAFIFITVLFTLVLILTNNKIKYE